MVGDDIVNDIEGAQAAGLTGVLVRTGKFRDADLAKRCARPVLDPSPTCPGCLRG